jgi:stearoyl-CoA desaturase (delta-9 desaturase)
MTIIYQEYTIVIYLISGSITINWLSAGIINIASHRYGTQSWLTRDESRNSMIMQLWSWGEGLHNNHHYRPGSYSYRMNSGEFDACEWILKFCEKINLVKLPKNECDIFNNQPK